MADAYHPGPQWQHLYWRAAHSNKPGLTVQQVVYLINSQAEPLEVFETNCCFRSSPGCAALPASTFNQLGCLKQQADW